MSVLIETLKLVEGWKVNVMRWEKSHFRQLLDQSGATRFFPNNKQRKISLLQDFSIGSGLLSHMCGSFVIGSHIVQHKNSFRFIELFSIFAHFTFFSLLSVLLWVGFTSNNDDDDDSDNYWLRYESIDFLAHFAFRFAFFSRLFIWAAHNLSDHWPKQHKKNGKFLSSHAPRSQFPLDRFSRLVVGQRHGTTWCMERLRLKELWICGRQTWMYNKNSWNNQRATAAKKSEKGSMKLISWACGVRDRNEGSRN